MVSILAIYKTLYKTLISVRLEYKTRSSKNVKFHDKITYFDFEGSYYFGF